MITSRQAESRIAKMFNVTEEITAVCIFSDKNSSKWEIVISPNFLMLKIVEIDEPYIIKRVN